MPPPQGTQRQLRLCSPFAVVVVLLSLAVLVAFVAFVVLVAPFVFAPLVVCAAGAVRHVVVAELVIKQNNKEANRQIEKQKATKAEQTKHI
jgi:fatty acid desaturase